MTSDPSCAPLRFGGWICDDCGTLNDAEDASCECEREAERREDMRRAIIAWLENLSPAERRTRLVRLG